MRDLTEWRNQLKEEFGDDVSFQGSNLGRFSSGIYSLDLALGGGWPLGHLNLLVGYESCGKSTVAAKAGSEMNKINWDTGELDLSYENPAAVLYVDQEGTFDTSWAKKNGFDTSLPVNEVVQLSDGQKMVDVVTNAIVSEQFGLIIVDSLESTMSFKVLEQSAMDAYMGDRARILNDGYRRWVMAKVRLSSKYKSSAPWKIPTIIAINQLREKIGVLHGDPSVIPGGIGQRQNSSIIVRMYKPKAENDTVKTYGMGSFHGITQKNKTFSPFRNFQFDMALIGTDKLKQGEVDNAGSIFRDAKELDLLYKDGTAWCIGDERFRVQADFREKLQTDPVYLSQMWKIVAEKWRIAAENRKEENVESEQE